MKKFLVALVVSAFMWPTVANADKIGSVVTEKKFIGSNSTVQIEAIDDPQIKNIVCYLSYPVTGGVMADIGLGSDSSHSSIACRSIGPIDMNQVKAVAKNPTDVFKRSTAFFFKSMKVVRFWDQKRNVLVYLTFSRKWKGTPKNSVSVVVLHDK